jgi:hypothetical protein
MDERMEEAMPELEEVPMKEESMKEEPMEEESMEEESMEKESMEKLKMDFLNFTIELPFAKIGGEIEFHRDMDVVLYNILNYAMRGEEPLSLGKLISKAFSITGSEGLFNRFKKHLVQHLQGQKNTDFTQILDYFKIAHCIQIYKDVIRRGTLKSADIKGLLPMAKYFIQAVKFLFRAGWSKKGYSAGEALFVIMKFEMSGIHVKHIQDCIFLTNRAKPLFKEEFMRLPNPHPFALAELAAADIARALQAIYVSRKTNTYKKLTRSKWWANPNLNFS